MDNSNLIFALDIGTRSVVGAICTLESGKINILSIAVEFHDKRAMRDGQIEDMRLVSKSVNRVKERLEHEVGQTFSKVCLAAAGRSLKTVNSEYTYNLSEGESISDQTIAEMDFAALSKAKDIFSSDNTSLDYYCVGYSTVSYKIDGYPLRSLLGQEGKEAEVSIVAAFLPSSVLVSLYAVASNCNLEVDNLTLEPIAAVTAVVPDDIRLLNIALVDIGGGTSDIAISKNGSIVAYDMLTTAGDEVTEALMQKYLTSFSVAEEIKLSIDTCESISFKDIMGNAVTVTSKEVYEILQPIISELSTSICDAIVAANDGPPAAVFLVGGGSKLKGLSATIADMLDLPLTRVAIGVANCDADIIISDHSFLNPDYVTPIGIALVSAIKKGYDFFSITVNEKKITLFNNQDIKVLDAISLAGIKPSSLIGRTPTSLVYTVNGKKKILGGSASTPGRLTVNGKEASIESRMSGGDSLVVIPAESGIIPTLSLYEAISDIKLNDMENTSISVNGNLLSIGQILDYQVSYMDEIVVEETKPLPMPASAELQNTDDIPKAAEPPNTDDIPNAAEPPNTNNMPDESVISYDMDNAKATFTPSILKTIEVTLNGKTVRVEQDTVEEPLIVMHLLKYITIVPSDTGQLVITVNGQSSTYSDFIFDQDVIIIKWEI